MLGKMWKTFSNSHHTRRSTFTGQRQIPSQPLEDVMPPITLVVMNSLLDHTRSNGRMGLDGRYLLVMLWLIGIARDRIW
jgi:hypothetical protein